MLSKDIKLSKFISFVLRHKPSAINLNMDEQGYVEVDSLIKGMNQVGHTINYPTLQRIVQEDDKNRYSYSEDGMKIRANQGHSIKGLNLDLVLVSDVGVLYHGTAHKNLNSILKQGIKPMQREYVHMTDSIDVALTSGQRYGDALVIKIDTNKMEEDNIDIYKSTNGVFLTKYVDPKYLDIC